MTDEEKQKPLTVKFHKDVQLNGVLFKAGWVTEVPTEYWLTEGHRHGELVSQGAQGAVQERRAEKEAPRDGGPRGGQQEGGEGVRPGQQGQEATGTGSEDRGEEGLLSAMKGAFKSKPSKPKS